MRLTIVLLFVVVLVCAVSGIAQTVAENATQIIMGERSASVVLNIDSLEDTRSARLRLSFLSPAGEEKNVAETDVELVRGRNRAEVPVYLADLVKEPDFAFYRLHYRIGAVEGAISLSRIAGDIFDLEAFAFDVLQKGSVYRIRSRAIQPVTLRGVANVQISGVLQVDYADGTKSEFAAAKATDTDGFADLSFELDSTRTAESIELKIGGAKNGFRQELAKNVPEHNLKRYSFIYFQTDKPIYQPGQMLKVRTLFFDENKKALSGETLVFQVKGPDDNILQTFETKTSRFGIASFECQVPENAKLGEYSVVVKSTRELQADRKPFNVSRYEMPNFAVAAAPDREFYLPENKTASITVTADYLFGKPVTNAKVRVVRETERAWDRKLARMVTKEGEVREGVIGLDGKYLAEFDLRKEHTEYDTGSSRFLDLRFAAYVTDLTTNKTEQKRFDIRLTKKPIHIYLVGETNNVSRRLPARFFVTTFYADGTPAECDVKIYLEHEDSDSDEKPKLGKLLVMGRTNRFGVAKVLVPFGSLAEDGDEMDLVVTANDGNGKSSFTTDDLDIDLERPAVQISTEKVIYATGEPLRVSVLSSEAEAVLFVDVMQGAQTLTNEKIRLAGGRATLEIPYAENFRGAVTIVAYGSYRSEYGTPMVFSDNKTVAYPNPSGLNITATSGKNVFRPGDEATIDLSSIGANGRAEETAFGVVVLDKAIEERAKTDANFGRDYRPFYSDLSDILNVTRGVAEISEGAAGGAGVSKPISPDAELAIELGLRSRFVPDLDDSGNMQRALNHAYRPFFDKQFKRVTDSLAKHYNDEGLAPVDETSLKSILMRDLIDLGSMSDPWGNPFRSSVVRSRSNSIVTVSSPGADEIANTPDDITTYTSTFKYFNATGFVIDKAFAEYHNRTGEFVQNYKALRDELKTSGFDLNRLRDAWGKPYRFSFGIEKANYTLKIDSGGWDRKFGGYDDFTIWTTYLDYFAVMRSNMSRAFREQVLKTQAFPANSAEFTAVLRSLGFDLGEIKDLFGRTYYVAEERAARYADRKTFGSQTKVVPVTQDLVIYVIKSTGKDGLRDTQDDFELSRFVGIVAETTKDAVVDRRARVVPVSGYWPGSIAGSVADANGAVIAKASVTIASGLTEKAIRETVTDDAGRFSFTGLDRGLYELRFVAMGFKTLILQNVVVAPQNLTEFNVTMDVGTVDAVVNVTAATEIFDNTVNTSSARISTEIFFNTPLARLVQGMYSIAPTVARSGLRDASGRDRDPSVAGSGGPAATVDVAAGPGGSGVKTEMRAPIETPRLREYFPETLVWFPELISSPSGTAQVKFKLADSMTTWKIGVIGSTANGDVGVVEKEITAFQPFFVDLDPPKYLTEGDEIFLPTQVRNYTDKKQKVNVTMAKADWFSFLGSDTQSVDVDPASSANAIFRFRAASSVKDGRQRVTAIAQTDSDAIEKPVTVRPNGQEIVRAESKVFNGNASFDIDFPAGALARTQKAELKLYPNLFSHISESVEGLLQRPYGCGEQTISSTYPNLMILKFVKADAPVRLRAAKYLQKGYERLLGYQTVDGGFTYWGAKDTPDVALTAYALRFLNDARSQITVDEGVIKRAGGWLVRQQRADGSWATKNHYETAEDLKRTKLTTTYVARSLSMLRDGDKPSLEKALLYLKSRNAEIDEPYAMALYASAALDAGDRGTARAIANRLEKMAIAEAGAVYWNLETNTPFYGWGTAGRVETTALVLQLLMHDTAGNEPSRKDLIGKGMLFLLRNKDRYGVWHSTQTTINVLDAFLAALESSKVTTDRTIDVLVGGVPVQSIVVGADQIDPVTLDLTAKLGPAANRVEVRAPVDAAFMAQVVATHYIDWRDAASTSGSRTVSLAYNCDKTEAAIMEDVTCSVEAERVGFRGYGMLLAEIGTPPGADVSRESLEKAMAADNGISRYDILPDRIIVYMWSKPGGTKFSFKFRPRYGITAQTPASVIYDYYNPEAQAVVSPLRFTVK